MGGSQQWATADCMFINQHITASLQRPSRVAPALLSTEPRAFYPPKMWTVHKRTAEPGFCSCRPAVPFYADVSGLFVCDRMPISHFQLTCFCNSLIKFCAQSAPLKSVFNLGAKSQQGHCEPQYAFVSMSVTG